MTGTTPILDTIIQGEAIEEMRKLPDGCIDMILCDLPYGTTACKWDQVIPFEPLWKEYKRLIKERGAIVLTASQPFTSLLIASNLKGFRCEWIWQKSNGGGFLNANKYPLKRHENILVFSETAPVYYPQKTRGERYSCRSSSAGETTQDQTVAGWITNNSGDRYPTTVLTFPNDTGLHPTQKPVALFEYLIKTYTNECDLVLDNCIGSGTTAVACKRTGRHWIGIEKEAAYCDIARKRIAAIPASLSRWAEG